MVATENSDWLEGVVKLLWQYNWSSPRISSNKSWAVLCGRHLKDNPQQGFCTWDGSGLQSPLIPHNGQLEGHYPVDTMVTY